MYLLRLDDASEYMDVEKWTKMEVLLESYKIKPIVGVIPKNQDENFVDKYPMDPSFWNKARAWQAKEWTIALHGYTHVYSSNDGGIHPVSERSEFAGVPLEEQRKKILNGLKIFREKGLSAPIFFAPSHTFDLNTLEALRLESDIRIISDTIATNIYKFGDFHFIPQQTGRARKLPFKVTTFCYHPNSMEEKDFYILENYIKKNKSEFVTFEDLKFTDRSISLYDKVLNRSYFLFRNIRKGLTTK